MAKKTEWPFDKSVADTICDLVAEGKNLHIIGKLKDYPPRWRIYEWLSEFPDFADNYARAREDRADWRSSRIDSVTQKLLDAEIDPAAARVIIDAEKWQAGKEKPKVYGDKTVIEGGEKPIKTESSIVGASDALVAAVAEAIKKAR